jgi:hypothetical protein
MRIIEISRKKQENGLWGMPLNCFRMENDRISSKNEVLHSAIVAAVNEKYNRSFEIFMMSDTGFAIQVYTNGVYDNENSQIFYFKYSDYEIIDYKLYEFHSPEDDQEHIVFLRKKKLNQLENI